MAVSSVVLAALTVPVALAWGASPGMVVGGVGVILTLVAMTATRREEHTEYVVTDVDPR